MGTKHEDIQATPGMLLEVREIDMKDAIDQLLKQVPFDSDSANDPKKMENHKDNLRKTLYSILDGQRSPQGRWLERLCRMVGMLRPDGVPDNKEMQLALAAINDAKRESPSQRAPRRIEAALQLIISNGQRIKPAVIQHLTDSFARFLDHQERLRAHTKKKKRLILKGSTKSANAIDS